MPKHAKIKLQLCFLGGVGLCLGFAKTGTGFVLANRGGLFFGVPVDWALFWPGLRKPRFCFGVAFPERVLFWRAAARQKETISRQNAGFCLILHPFR